jgi:hypothetical protein
MTTSMPMSSRDLSAQASARLNGRVAAAEKVE